MPMHHRRFLLAVPEPGRVLVRLAGVLAAALLWVGVASADWPADGVVLCSACRARGVIVAPDGAGGAFVAWTDERNSTTGTNDDVFMQHVTASGAIAPGWPADGLPVSLAQRSQLTVAFHSIVSDGLGGVIVAWIDYRHAPDGTGSDIYALRVLAGGTLAPGWPVDGAPVARTPSNQQFPVVLADGNGGAYFTWTDESADPDVFVQHLGPDGGVMPSWPVNGLPVCTAPGFQGYPRLAPDGTGGVLIAWGHFDAISSSSAQRVGAGGEIAPGWPENGIQMTPSSYVRELVSDGAGGAFVLAGIPAPLYFTDLYLQRFTGSGALAPGWPGSGVPVCIAPDERVGMRMEPDDAGGVVMVWSDYRDHSDSDVFALRMRADGTRWPGWPVNGLAVTVNPALDDYTDLVSDGQGGAYVTWNQYSFETDQLVMVQHLTGAGTVAPGWPVGGRAIPSLVGSPQPKIAADGLGGAIVVWDDYYGEARALRLGPDGPVPVAVSQASVEAEAGLVRLTWYAGGGIAIIADVERRTELSEWGPIASITTDGSGALRYEDRTVVSGLRYAYRLTYRDAAEILHTAETWVAIPALRFALRGLTPNPSAGDPVVSFSLASGEQAMLEVFDLRGRLVLMREVGGLGPGIHALRVGEGVRLAAGVYALRLRQGAQIATTRAVVLR